MRNRVAATASTEWLTCCYHQHGMHILATRPEIEVQDTVYVASTRMHRTVSQLSLLQIQSHFDSYYLVHRSYSMIIAATETLNITHLNS